MNNCKILFSSLVVERLGGDLYANLLKRTEFTHKYLKALLPKLGFTQTGKERGVNPVFAEAVFETTWSSEIGELRLSFYVDMDGETSSVDIFCEDEPDKYVSLIFEKMSEDIKEKLYLQKHDSGYNIGLELGNTLRKSGKIENIPMPSGMDKAQILDLLLREEYGYLPEKPSEMAVETVVVDESFCAGKANLVTLKLSCTLRGQKFSFPVHYTRRVAEKKSPCFIHINFRDAVPDRYQPTEELVDNGYNILSFCYEDVTSDDGDFTNGLAGIVYPDGKRDAHDCGKIGLWAWAAMRVMDYAVTCSELDGKRISVAGHSRLGKTALLAGALDERFYCAFSNDSGCSGAAISRQKLGETIGLIHDRFPFWFCENYAKYIDNEDALPFDQHFLLAANYPHRVYVASAAKDWWACPENEYAACLFAAPYYNEKGLETCLADEMPAVGSGIGSGYIGYHIREGRHYFSREDWLRYIKYLQD